MGRKSSALLFRLRLPMFVSPLELRVPQLRFQPICKSQRTSARLEQAGKFVWGPATKRGVGPEVVVVLAPGCEDEASLI